MIPAGEVHYVFSPQLPQELNLLLAPPAPVAEIFSQRLVLHVVPADADTQAEASAGEHVDFCRLFGHQGGLPLSQDQYLGSHPDSLGEGCQVSKEHKGFVK